MAFDGTKNFAYSTVLTAPSPATSGTSLVVQAGDGARFPTPPFNVVVWPIGANPTTSNVEIARCTAIVTDTMTIVRGATSGAGLNGEVNNANRSIIVGDQIAWTWTTKNISDIQNGLIPFLTKTSNYSLAVTDYEILCDPSGGAFTVTLPDPATVPTGKVFIVKRTDNAATSGLNPLTVVSAAGLIEGVASDIMATPLESATYISNGTNYYKQATWLPALAHSARVIIYSTSHDAPARNPYAATSVAWQESGLAFFPWDGNQLGGALKDSFTTGQYAENTHQYIVPAVATASDLTWFLDYMPADGTIEYVAYVPQATITGATTNNRTFQFQVDTASGTNQTLFSQQFNSGTNATVGQYTEMINLNSGGGLSATNIFFPQAITPYYPAIRSTTGSTAPYSQGLWWKSTHNGSGIADPGGVLFVRYGTRTRNYSVTGSTLMGMGGPTLMNWTTPFSWCATSRPSTVEINVTATASTSATSISCSALQFPLLTGSLVKFTSGHTATTTAAANYGATSITVSALANSIIAGEQGHAADGNSTGGGAYESLSPQGLNIFFTGVNDTAQTIDRPAWKEIVRACISRVCCPAFDTVDQGNVVYTNGGGTWAALTASVGLSASGQLPYIFRADGTLADMKKWTGTVSGTPKFIDSMGPAFEGGTSDLFFLVPAGPNCGVTASVTVDGATPSQGAVTINTESVGTSGLHHRTMTGTYSTAASTTITLSSASAITGADLGKCITGTNIPAGTTITAITDTTHVVLSNATTGTTSGLTATVRAWIPMVKRITGLTAGAHTFTVTVTASTAVATSVLGYMGRGIESYNPTTPVAWVNILTAVGVSTTNAANYNTDSQNVINGTATVVSGNSTEPAFGANVQYIDVASLFNQSPIYFLPDGLHLNSAGHRLVDRTIFKNLNDFYSPDQLIAR